MELKQKSIEFLKFKPKNELLKIYKSFIDKLELDAPSDSFIKVVVEKTKKQFKVQCRVCSQSGVFTSESVGVHPGSLISDLEHKIGLQLKQWKNRRNNLIPKVS